VLGDLSHLLLVPKIVVYSLVMIAPPVWSRDVGSRSQSPIRGLGFFFIFVGSSVARHCVARHRSSYAGFRPGHSAGRAGHHGPGPRA
jgi:hypothetical protein